MRSLTCWWRHPGEVPDRTAACPPIGCSPADATTEISSRSIPTDYWPRTSKVQIAESPSSSLSTILCVTELKQCRFEKCSLDFQLHLFWSSVCCPILYKRIRREITTGLCAFFLSKDGRRIFIWNQWIRVVLSYTKSLTNHQAKFYKKSFDMVW